MQVMKGNDRFAEINDKCFGLLMHTVSRDERSMLHASPGTLLQVKNIIFLLLIIMIIILSNVYKEIEGHNENC